MGGIIGTKQIIVNIVKNGIDDNFISERGIKQFQSVKKKVKGRIVLNLYTIDIDVLRSYISDKIPERKCQVYLNKQLQNKFTPDITRVVTHVYLDYIYRYYDYRRYMDPWGNFASIYEWIHARSYYPDPNDRILSHYIVAANLNITESNKHNLVQLFKTIEIIPKKHFKVEEKPILPKIF